MLTPKPLEFLPASSVGRGTARLEQLLQYRQFERRNPGVIHQVLGAARFQLLAKGRRFDQPSRRFAVAQLGQRGYVDVQDIEQQTARRRIGAGVLRVIRKQRVQRVEPDHVGAVGRGEFD